ncbi:MAG TPA: NlpC/P60 family protein [Rhodothermales bacterium]
MDAPTETVEAPAVVDLLRSEVRTWEGTPHRLGGQNRSGVDCSGFVMRVYDDVFGLSLPRTTEDQAQEGREVSASSLVPGDLVFFRTAPKTRHVGIYLSDGEFAHASSSDGVRVSHLDEPYWRRTYWMSRRVLDGDDVSMTPGARSDEELEEVDSAAESPTRAARTGW